MKAKVPEKIFVHLSAHLGLLTATAIQVGAPGETAYIRKDIFDATIQSAEDHAYFAGQEKFREKMLAWAKNRKKELTADSSFVAGERKILTEVIDKLEKI